MCIALVCAPSLAQGQKKKSPPTPPRAAPALIRDPANQRDWTLHAEVRMRPIQPRGTDARALPATPFFELAGAEFLYPVLRGSAMHFGWIDRIKGELQISGRVVDKAPEILDGYQSLSSIAVWEAGEFRTQSVVFIGEFPMTTYETRIDEKAARQRSWPGLPWSAEMALCLEPQLFVQSSDAAVQALVQEWTGGDPRRTKPYDLAKLLAGKVIQHMRVTIQPTSTQPRGPEVGKTPAIFLEGFNVFGAASAATEKQGSIFDLACLLTAVYRAAGLPARLVIGIDQEQSERLRSTIMRSWVEFFLPSEPAVVPGEPPPAAVTSKDGEWIPVDIGRQWEFSNRPPPMNQRWQYFGHNEEFDFVIPIAFHWLPPEDCQNSGTPAIWGWRPKPVNPAADVEIKFWAYETPRKSGEKRPTPP